MYLQRLQWDSEFFGYEIGKATIENVEDFEIDIFKKEANIYRLVYLFSDYQIDCPGLTLVDKKVLFNRKTHCKSSFSSKTDIVFYDENKHDIKQLIKLSLISGTYSRFAIDPNFKKTEYNKLYKQWILNSINEKLPYKVLLAVDENTILGFVTLGYKTREMADIGLVAVCEQARGRGVGTALIDRAVFEARKNNFSKIQVVTQLENSAAIKLYAKSGFKKKKLTYIYHYWKHDTI